MSAARELYPSNTFVVEAPPVCMEYLRTVGPARPEARAYLERLDVAWQGEELSLEARPDPVSWPPAPFREGCLELPDVRYRLVLPGGLPARKEAVRCRVEQGRAVGWRGTREGIELLAWDLAAADALPQELWGQLGDRSPTGRAGSVEIAPVRAEWVEVGGYPSQLVSLLQANRRFSVEVRRTRMVARYHGCDEKSAGDPPAVWFDGGVLLKRWPSLKAGWWGWSWTDSWREDDVSYTGHLQLNRWTGRGLLKLSSYSDATN